MKQTRIGRLMRTIRNLWRNRRIPVLSSRDAYALWAENYPPVAHNQLMAIEEKTMRALCPSLSGLHVVDVGAGSGRYTQIAYRQSPASLLSLDDSLAMLQHNDALHRIQASADVLPLVSGQTNIILCGLVIGHLPELEMLFAEFARILAPTGMALVSDFHPSLASRGALRTFNHDGKTLAVVHHIHPIETIKRIALAHDLVCDALEEPILQKDGQAMTVIVAYRFRKR